MGGHSSLRKTGGTTHFLIKVLAGGLPCRSCEFVANGTAISVIDGKTVQSHQTSRDGRTIVSFEQKLQLAMNDEIHIEVHG